MTGKRQTREIELKRRIKMAVAALKAVDDCLELEQDDATLSPDLLADRIRAYVKAKNTRTEDSRPGLRGGHPSVHGK